MTQRLQRTVFILLAALCVTPLVSSPVALALGFMAAIFLENPYQQRVQKHIRVLLQVSIVGLGFGLKLNEALHAGREGFLLTVISIFSVLVLGYLFGKMLKIDKKLSYLVSSGTAICGGSAIAAVSPIIRADARFISVALAIVFSLNSIALFVFPVLGHALALTQEQFGLWCAVGIHDTSSVVGAANKYGAGALKVATTVKLARALWIIPLSIISVFLFKSKSVKIKIPWFIGYFILAILANSYFPVIDTVSPYITAVARAGLNLTLFFIGSTLSLETLKSIGVKPLVLAVLLWVIISVGTLILILN